MKEQAAKDQKEYDEKMQEASGIISEISGWVKEVKVKYERLNRLTYKFATDYYPLSDHNEDMAMKFMAKAYSFTDEEKRMRVLNESKNQLTRMEWMVLSLLKLARIEAGAIQFDRKECDLKLLLLQARDSVTYLTESREQEVHVICEDGRKLVCDGDWLVEAIINLLKNASDYSPEKTEITVEVEHNPVFTRIYVKDHGMGIAEKDIGNIFKRFYRVHHDVNPNSVGIGLSLTKSIVEGMGGKITVRSEEGAYTWFIITFVHVD